MIADLLASNYLRADEDDGSPPPPSFLSAHFPRKFKSLFAPLFSEVLPSFKIHNHFSSLVVVFYPKFALISFSRMTTNVMGG